MTTKRKCGITDREGGCTKPATRSFLFNEGKRKDPFVYKGLVCISHYRKLRHQVIK